MSIDWYPGIREACAYWYHAPMLQQTFEALERIVADENDAAIDCAKAIVEVVCRIIVDELDSTTNPAKPKEADPSFSQWISSATVVLKLGGNQNAKFRKLVSQYHKLTTALGELRNDAGPVSHGRDGFLNRLSIHHRRSAVLSADAIITFLHQAYLEADLELERSNEPYECDRFTSFHEQIDGNVSLATEIDENGLLNVTIILPTGDTQSLLVPPSRLLYQLDRIAYRETLNAVRSISPNTDAI